jgi:hypothetical protein
MGEELKQTYTIRIPAEIATRIEEAAGRHGIAPTTFIQSLIIREFKSGESTDREPDIAYKVPLGGKLETLQKSIERLERGDCAGFDQLRFEIVKTRAALLHSLDQTFSTAVVDQIIEASDQTAREYTAGVTRDLENKP